MQLRVATGGPRRAPPLYWPSICWLQEGGGPESLSGRTSLTRRKFFQVDNPFKWSAYLRCLCGLEWLISEKGMSAVSAEQDPEYYACLLASANPAAVPLDRPAQDYTALLFTWATAAPELGAEVPEGPPGEEAPIDG